MTSQQPGNSPSAEPETPDTEVIAVPAPAPVFVDSTGRRSKLLRRLAYAFGVVVLLYGGLISVSLAGGPVSSSAVLPLPGLETDVNDSRAPARPSPPPVPSASSRALFVANTLPRRATVNHSPAGRIESTRLAPKPPAKPTPSKTPSPKPSTSHPVESTSTPATSATPSAGSPTTPSTKSPASPTGPIVAPVPPGGGTDSGGQGGGSVLSGDDTAGGSGEDTTGSSGGGDTGNDTGGSGGTPSGASSSDGAPTSLSPATTRSSPATPKTAEPTASPSPALEASA